MRVTYIDIETGDLREAKDFDDIEQAIEQASLSLDGDNLAEEGLDTRNLEEKSVTTFDRDGSASIEMAGDWDTASGPLNNTVFAQLVLGTAVLLDWTLDPIVMTDQDALEIEGFLIGSCTLAAGGRKVSTAIYIDIGAGLNNHLVDSDSSAGNISYRDETLLPGALYAPGAPVTVYKVAIFAKCEDAADSYIFQHAQLYAVLHRKPSLP